MKPIFLVLLFPLIGYAQALELIREDVSRLQRDEQIKKAPALPKATAIVKFNTKRGKIRLSANCGTLPVDVFDCDIGLSEFLVEVPQREEEKRVVLIPKEPIPLRQEPVFYEYLVRGMKAKDEAHLLFKPDINETTVGLKVKVISRRKLITVELEPRYILPSGFEGELSERGLAQGRANVDKLDLEIERLNQIRNRLNQSESAIDSAQALKIGQTTNEYRDFHRKDTSALRQLAEYVPKVFERGSVYVLIHSGNKILPGTVK